MANFTSADVMKLREQTGVGMMDCKKALVQTDGNFEEAIKYLREKGMASAAKKQSRVAAEGLVKCLVAEDKKSGVAVEINCETDFVARSDQFLALIDNIAHHLLQTNAKSVEEVMEEAYYQDPSKTINVLIAEATAAIGEKISLRRFTKFALSQSGIVASYIHMGGKIGVLTEIVTEAAPEAVAELAANVCMQIAASKPQVINIAVDASQLESEREILTVQAKNEGKPEAVIAKMVEGRIHKYYKEVCLMEQEYVRDSSMSIKQVVAETEKTVGAKIAVTAFVRYEMGEGIEKRHENFAEEIQKQING